MLTQGAGALNAGGATALAAALDLSKPLGEWWLTTRVTPTTTLGPERWPGRSGLSGATDIVWGDQIFWNDPAWAQHIVWGDQIVWGDRIVWSESVVWGDRIVWSNQIVRGNSTLGYTTDGTRIIWGDRIVWSDVAAERVVGATWPPPSDSCPPPPPRVAPSSRPVTTGTAFRDLPPSWPVRGDSHRPPACLAPRPPPVPCPRRSAGLVPCGLIAGTGRTRAAGPAAPKLQSNEGGR